MSAEFVPNLEAKTCGGVFLICEKDCNFTSPVNAEMEFFMSKMNVRRKQVVIDIDKAHSAIIQAGAMQWMAGDVRATSGVKGVGEGCLVLEPTYKYVLLVDVAQWGSAGMTIEDGMFLACNGNVL